METLREKKLNNGVQVSFYNGSRQVAGDRWEVLLKIVSTIPLLDSMIKQIAKNKDSKYYLEKFNGILSFELDRKRHFVDDHLVDDTLEELMDLAESNMIEYLNSPNFADKLFLKQMEQFKEQCLLERQVEQNEKVCENADEPDDFSACFK